MAFVAARVAPYKKVRRLEFVDQIPKSPSGKILRRVLVERERAAVARAGPRRMSALALTTPTTPESVDVAEAEMAAEVDRLFAEQINPLRLFPGGALAVYRGGRLVLDLVARVRRHPARRAGDGRHALPPLLRHEAVRGGRPLAADRARPARPRRPGCRALAGVRPERQGPRPGPSRPLPPRRLPDDPSRADAGPVGRLGGGDRGHRSDADRARAGHGQRLPLPHPAAGSAPRSSAASTAGRTPTTCGTRSPARSACSTPTSGSRHEPTPPRQAPRDGRHRRQGDRHRAPDARRAAPPDGASPAPAASRPPATWPASTPRWRRAARSTACASWRGDRRADAARRGRRGDRCRLRRPGSPRPRVRARRT